MLSFKVATMNLLYLAVLCVSLLPIDNSVLVEDSVASLEIATIVNGDAIDRIEEVYTKYIFRGDNDEIIDVIHVPYAEPGEGRIWPAPMVRGNQVTLYTSEYYLTDRKDSRTGQRYEFLRKVHANVVKETFYFACFDPDQWESSNLWPRWHRTGLSPMYQPIKDWYYWQKKIVFAVWDDYW